MEIFNLIFDRMKRNRKLMQILINNSNNENKNCFDNKNGLNGKNFIENKNKYFIFENNHSINKTDLRDKSLKIDDTFNNKNILENNELMNIKRDTINQSIIQDNIKKRHEERKYNINKNYSNDFYENSFRILKSRNYNQEILSVIKKNKQISEIIHSNLNKEKDEKKKI